MHDDGWGSQAHVWVSWPTEIREIVDRLKPYGERRTLNDWDCEGRKVNRDMKSLVRTACVRVKFCYARVATPHGLRTSRWTGPSAYQWAVDRHDLRLTAYSAEAGYTESPRDDHSRPSPTLCS